MEPLASLLSTLKTLDPGVLDQEYSVSVSQPVLELYTITESKVEMFSHLQQPSFNLALGDRGEFGLWLKTVSSL